MTNTLKSLFISFVISFCLVASVIAARYLYNELSLIWFGVLIASLPIVSFIGWLFVVGAARTSPNLNHILMISSIGLLITSYGALSYQGSAYLPMLLALIASISTFIYIYWYSRFNERDNPKLAVGKTLPSFSFTNLDNQEVSSDSFVGQKTLMIFYRGNWCPLCMVQIKEIAESYKELAKSGVRIALISPQPPKHTESLAKKFDVPFEFYVDNNNKAAKTLDILASNGLPFGLQVFGYDSDTVMPTVIISDEANEIIFSDLTDNYRVRPEPQVFLDILANSES